VSDVILTDRRIYRKRPLEFLREHAAVLSLGLTVLVATMTAHAFVVRLSLAEAVAQALAKHDQDAYAHGPLRALYPSPKEHARAEQVMDQLALSVEQIKSETREEHAKMLANQAEMSREIARIESSLKARGMGVSLHPYYVGAGATR
jgi:hypothetical protein